MSVIVVLIISSLLVASGFLMAFIWSVSKGQYDEGSSPSIRMLYEDQTPTDSPSPSQNP